MFGRYLRAIALVPAAILFGAFLDFVLGVVLSFTNTSAGQSKLYGFFAAVQGNFLTVAFLSILVLLLVGAAVERGVAQPR